LKKEPWDSSTEKAKTLLITDFGEPDEVRKMAESNRQAANRYEAEKALENIISNNGTVKRTAIELKSKSGLYAVLRRSSIKEYLDPLAKAKLYSIEAIDFGLDKKKEDAGTLTAINL